MFEEIIAYEKYLLKFGVVDKPYMPNFDVFAYTDNEYLFAISDVMDCYERIDDEGVTIDYLLNN